MHGLRLFSRRAPSFVIRDTAQLTHNTSQHDSQAFFAEPKLLPVVLSVSMSRYASQYVSLLNTFFLLSLSPTNDIGRRCFFPEQYKLQPAAGSSRQEIKLLPSPTSQSHWTTSTSNVDIKKEALGYLWCPEQFLSIFCVHRIVFPFTCFASSCLCFIVD